MTLRSTFRALAFTSALAGLHCAQGSEDNGGPYGAGAGSSVNTVAGFTLLVPPLGPPLDPQGGAPLSPPPPAGWVYYPIDGAICRDGSPAGFFARFTGSSKLFVYFEGGGACTNLGFCNFNPSSVNKAISGDGQSVLGSALGVVDARQQPGVFSAGLLQGVYDDANTQNPLKGWNGIYIPYCTGDVHFGTRRNATVPGVTQPQQFVGYLNMQKFVGRIVPPRPARNRWLSS